MMNKTNQQNQKLEEEEEIKDNRKKDSTDEYNHPQWEFKSFIQADRTQIAIPELQKMSIKGQIFYDTRSKAFIFREKENVVYVQAGNGNNTNGDSKKIFSFKIPYEKKIFAMSLHQSKKYIAYSIADNTLVILNLQEGNSEQRIKMSNYDQTQKILHFSWVYQRTNEKNIDFVLCEKTGVRLYKILDDKCILKEQKYYEINCTAAWYENVSQVLLVANLKENGKLYTFFFADKKSQLKYRGPEFYLEDVKKEKKSIDIFITLLQSIQQMDIFESQSSSNNSNSNTQISRGMDSLTSKSYKTQFYFDECNSQLSLLNIYSKTYLVFANQMDGKIIIYHLLYEKISCLDWKISIPSDSLISLCIVEDLLLVNSTQNQISIIYDIKRQMPSTPLGPPQPIFIKHHSNIYEKHVICLGDEWIIDLENIDIYRFKVELPMIHSMIEGDVECFNIILRRDNPKEEAIDFIKKRIEQQIEINVISIYFKHIFEIYKEAQKDTTLLDTNSSSLISETIKLVNQTKIKQGYTIIYPSDLHSDLLLPIVQNTSISPQYIIEILSEYLRLAYNNGIIQLIKTQELLIEVVLKQGNYNTLHFLIQYKILSDTSDLAKKLINMSCPNRIQKIELLKNQQTYRPGFQLGIDMLFRLKKLSDIVEIFFSFGMFQEGMDMIQRHHVYKMKAKNIAYWVYECEGNCSKNDVFRFFEYLLSSASYQNYINSQNSNSSSSSNKISFTMSQLKDEFKKAKEKYILLRSNNNKNLQQKQKDYFTTDDIVSPVKSSSQTQNTYRRIQTSANKNVGENLEIKDNNEKVEKKSLILVQQTVQDEGQNEESKKNQDKQSIDSEQDNNLFSYDQLSPQLHNHNSNNLNNNENNNIISEQNNNNDGENYDNKENLENENVDDLLRLNKKDSNYSNGFNEQDENNGQIINQINEENSNN